MIATRTVVLVEGLSDQIAVESLGGRQGRNFATGGITVVPMGGATNIRRYVRQFGQEGSIRLAILCDAREETRIRRSVERASLVAGLSGPGMGTPAFYVCVADLEDELIRALGPDSVEQIVERQGELSSFRRLQRQPAQRGRTIDAQLRRFMGTKSGRKARYARLLVDELDLALVPRPLDRLLRDL